MLHNPMSIRNSRRLALLLVVVLTFSACSPVTAPESGISTSMPEVETGTEVETSTGIELAEMPALLPYTNEIFGIESLVPEGWVDAGDGVYVRETDANDVALIIQQSAPLNPESLLSVILPQLLLTEPPESSGTFQGGTLDWTLYQVDLDVAAFDLTLDLALAETGGITYLVLLQASTEEYEALHTAVFLPTLEVFAPLDTELAQEDVPYLVENVTFENESANVTLAGTLTLPPTAGPHPVVVLVSGSGPQDRDSVISPGIAIRPFRLLADALTREGIAVLRYDDRGVANSTGDFSTAIIPDFAEDAEAAIDYLLIRPEIDPDQIGLIGHSEGAMVAAMLGARNEDLDFIIVLAGPGVPGYEVLTLQNQLVMEAEGATQEEIEAQLVFVEMVFDLVDDPEAVEALTYVHTLEQLQSLSDEERAEFGDIKQYARAVAVQTAQQYSTGWFQSFLEYDPEPDWEQITIPVLAVFGGKDVQIDAEQNAPALEAALQQAGNAAYEIVVLPNANHLFQEAETGAFSEYTELSAEFTPDLTPTLIEWLHQHVSIVE